MVEAHIFVQCVKNSINIFPPNSYLLTPNYSYLIASIGERLAAFRAGKTPKKIPIKDDVPIATNIDVISIAAGKKRRINKIKPVAINSPINPPIRDKSTDSAKN